MELHCDEKVLVIIFNLEGKKFLSSYILEGRIFGLKLVKLAVKRYEGGLICIVCMYVCGQKNSNKKRSKMNFSKMRN